jgi:electron transfer flavoprotein alpha subunit
MAALILIYGEIDGEKLSTSTKEALGIGRNIADALPGELIVLIIGGHIDDYVTKEAVCFGADKVVVVQNSELRNYQPELYLAVMEGLCKEIDPDIVLMSHSFVGSELAPRLAYRLRGGLATDCIELAIDEKTKQLLRTKPIYGGNVLTVCVSESKPQMATIREKVFPLPEGDAERMGEVVRLDSAIKPPLKKTKFIERIEEVAPGIKLEQADVIVCGGRGMGSAEAFAQLEQLAGILGGAVAGTRPACEKGWINPRLQVGLTGKKVSPKLYIAVGVSGAIQHMAGIIGAKCIVAIDKDPDANILNHAHYGAIGDYREILPAFKEKLEEMSKK